MATISTSGASAANPAATESWRRTSPPTMESTFVHPPSATRSREVARVCSPTTRITSRIDCACSAVVSTRARRGRPPSGRKTLSGAPKRSPFPAATMIAAATNCDRSGGCMRRSGEDHAPGSGLEHASYGHTCLGADERLAAIDDDHRAVFEEADALSGLASFLDDFEVDLFARQHRRPQRALE